MASTYTTITIYLRYFIAIIFVIFVNIISVKLNTFLLIAQLKYKKEREFLSLLKPQNQNKKKIKFGINQ